MKYRTFAFTDKLYSWLSPKPMNEDDEIELIIQRLQDNKPCMISRVGSVELQTLCYLQYKPFSFPIKNRSYRLVSNNAGFFPVNDTTLERFYQVYKRDILDMDVLVTWRIEELLLKSWFKGKSTIRKTTLDGFYHQENPWTRVLKGKHVLVIHPFAETIVNQYNTKRSELFKNPDTLPKFASLQTIKAVQSLAGNPTNFDNWFDALDWMKSEIDKCEFDIALIGCGAYALPLAAHVKRIGRKAVHMGGILQFLFGIKAVRYDENPETAAYINEHFVYPSAADSVANASLVEGGCYWGK